MKKRTATMTIIARRAGVSQATVSMALNGRGRVSAEVREEVQRIASEVGYHVRWRTAPVRDVRGCSVGVMLDRRFFDILDSFFIRILRGLQAEAEARGFSIVFCTVGEEHLSLGWRAALPASVSPDALVVVGVTDPDFIASFNDTNAPVAFVAAGVSGSTRFDTVASDDFQGMQEVVAHLQKLGHRHIAFVGGEMEHLSALERLRAYKVHMDEAFGAYDPSLVEIAEEGRAQSAGFETCTALLARRSPFTALVCMTDEMARGAVEALVWSGLCVPEDVSVVGFDNKEVAQVITPPLTTVQISCEEMGRMACEMVTMRLQKAARISPLHIKVAPELIVRASTAAVHAGAAPWTRSRYARKPAKAGSGTR
jgi:LacI family transcriptional regulator